MKKLNLKSVSYESFTKFGFWSGVVLGVIGVIVKILFPLSKISTGIPFFSYEAERRFLSLILFFVLTVLSVTIDFIIIALFINVVLKLSKGVDFYFDEE